VRACVPGSERGNGVCAHGLVDLCRLVFLPGGFLKPALKLPHSEINLTHEPDGRDLARGQRARAARTPFACCTSQWLRVPERCCETNGLQTIAWHAQHAQTLSSNHVSAYVLRRTRKSIHSVLAQLHTASQKHDKHAGVALRASTKERLCTSANEPGQFMTN
jgi:hypothetical protein